MFVLFVIMNNPCRPAAAANLPAPDRAATPPALPAVPAAQQPQPVDAEMPAAEDGPAAPDQQPQPAAANSAEAGQQEQPQDQQQHPMEVDTNGEEVLLIVLWHSLLTSFYNVNCSQH